MKGIWGRVFDGIGQWCLGKSVMERCEEERRRGGVGGDPVGPQILRGQRLSIPAPFRRVNALRVQSWRSTPDCCLFLALNASFSPFFGIKRQLDALFWR